MNKLKKIDEINDAFVEIMQEEGTGEYTRFIKSINRELVRNIETLTPDKVRQIVMSKNLNIEDTTLLFTILNAILLIIKAPSRRKPELLPILAIMSMYSLANPKRFVKKVIKINKGSGLNSNEKKARAHLLNYKQLNKDTIEQAHIKSMRQMKESLSKSSKNRQMMDDFYKFKKQGLREKQIRSKLLDKYNDQTSINRALRTELRAQSEFVKLEHSKTIGYTHKIWKTQQDERVRDTNFHKQVANARVPIDDEFTFGAARAQAPGDENLPPSERINCRCYLIYE